MLLGLKAYSPSKMNTSWFKQKNLSQQVQLARKATVIQALQVSREPQDSTELKGNVAAQAFLVGLGCAIRPCATAAWWGRIRTAKDQSFDAEDAPLQAALPSSRGRGGHSQEEFTFATSFFFLTVAKWFTANQPVSLQHRHPFIRTVLLGISCPASWKWNASNLMS